MTFKIKTSGIFRYIFNDLIDCFPARLLGKRYKGTPGNILIVNFQGIGNMILFTPALQTLRKAYPDARITITVDARGTKEVISESGLVDEIIEYDLRNDQDGSQFEKMTAYLRSLKIEFGLSCSPDSLEKLILFESQAKYRAGFKYKVPGYKKAGFLLHSAKEHDTTKHEVLQNLDLLKISGISDLSAEPVIYFSQKNLDSALEKIRRLGIYTSGSLIGLHAGSHENLKEKRWPLEHFAVLGDLLSEYFDTTIAFVGGSEEIKDIDDIRNRMNRDAVNLAGILSIKETAAIISGMKLFVSNDSGPMHIAAAVGTPVLGIFGPTSEVKNKPWPRKSVPAKTVRLPLSCAPCYIPHSSKISCKKPDCLRNLTPQMVFRQCLDMVSLGSCPDNSSKIST